MDDALVTHHREEADGEGEEANDAQNAEFKDGWDAREVLRGRGEGGTEGRRGGGREGPSEYRYRRRDMLQRLERK